MTTLNWVTATPRAAGAMRCSIFLTRGSWRKGVGVKRAPRDLRAGSWMMS